MFKFFKEKSKCMPRCVKAACGLARACGNSPSGLASVESFDFKLPHLGGFSERLDEKFQKVFSELMISDIFVNQTHLFKHFRLHLDVMEELLCVVSDDPEYMAFYKEMNEAIDSVDLNTEYTPQDFGSVLDTVGETIDFVECVSNAILPKDFIYHLEGIMLLLTGLSQSSGMKDAIAHICQYARNISGDSVANMIKKKLSKLAWSSQAGADDWLAVLRIAKQSWRTAVNNPHFANFQEILSMLISLGMCEVSSCNFTMGGVKIFRDVVSKTQYSAVDLIDAIINTVLSFVEGGFECFRQGNISPLLYGNIELSALEDQCDRCERLFEFARTGDTSKAEEGMTDATYFKLLVDTIEKLKLAKNTAHSRVGVRMLELKYAKLMSQKTQYERICTVSGLRIQPWAILIYGNSGVGKSSLANLLMTTSLRSNGYPYTDEYIVVENDFDKFDPQQKSYCVGLLRDDVCNTKHEILAAQNGAPSARFIKTVNNVRNYAMMADVNEKGKVTKEPKVVISTTNVKNMDSVLQSNCPLSIERRNAYILTVKVKDEFATRGMVDPEKLRRHYGDETPLITDIWNLTVERPYGIPSRTVGEVDHVGYEVVVHRGKKLENVSIYDVIRFNKDASATHFANQKQLVENQTNLGARLPWCAGCGSPTLACDCGHVDPIIHNDPPDISKQAVAPLEVFEDDSIESDPDVVEIDPPLEEQFGFLDRRYVSLAMGLGYEMTIGEAIARVNQLDAFYYRWTDWVPQSWFTLEPFRNFLLLCNFNEFMTRVLMAYRIFLVACFISVTVLVAVPVLWVRIAFILVLIMDIYALSHIISCERARLLGRIAESNASNGEIFRDLRRSAIKFITATSVILGILYTFARVFKRIRQSTYVCQGNLAPTTLSEICDRDKEAETVQRIAEEQGWDNRYIAPVPCSQSSSTCTTAQLANKVYKNLVQFKWIDPQGNPVGCDMLFVESNLAIIPHHIWKRDEMEIEVSRGTRSIQKFMCIISKKHSVSIPNSDLSLVYIPNAGSWADLRDYLPLVTYPSGRNLPARFVYKEMRYAEPIRKECDTFLRYQDVSVAGIDYFGAKYTLGFNTFSGLCMGTLVSNSKEAVILGFHTAGVRKTPQAAMCPLLRSNYEFAREELNVLSGVCIAASEGVLQQQMYGKPIFVSPTVHEKSPVRKLPNDAHIDVYGTCTGRATYYSKVVPTPIAKTVTELCDCEELFGKPKFHLGKAWEASLSVSCKPSIGVEPSLLVRACDDYRSHLFTVFESIPELAEDVRPLTAMENICGIDGKRFIDKINRQTSIGYPLSGAKEKYITLLDPDDYEDFACPAEIDPIFWEEVGRMEQEYLSDRRCHTVFKACLKDEPTKKTKDKVRTFQGAPVALQLVIRKFYLPIVRLFSVFPLDSECAVGVNTMGPEFSDLIEHMRKFGADRIFAGDYSKYDLRMPAQLILAAFDILIDVARQFGYSDDACVIMHGIATDIAYPVMAYNGDLLQHYGSNPSGQNLTVYINSIVNSLLMRSAYYKIYESCMNLLPFKEVVAVMTYGDDVKGSVCEGYDEFNHISYTHFLRDRDIVFTMPDKESQPTKYMFDEDADFLKRKNVYNDELEQWMGALSEDSIFKSLTSVLSSSVLTLKEQCVENIDGALREWFMYGKDHYEMRRAQMQLVAERHGLTTGCTMLSVSYEKAMDDYCKRYSLGSYKHPSVRSQDAR